MAPGQGLCEHHFNQGSRAILAVGDTMFIGTPLLSGKIVLLHAPKDLCAPRDQERSCTAIFTISEPSPDIPPAS